jgi:hypothetical protein
MNDSTAALAVLAGLALRLAVPILITVLVVAGLSSLDRRWQVEGRRVPLKIKSLVAGRPRDVRRRSARPAAATSPLYLVGKYFAFQAAIWKKNAWRARSSCRRRCRRMPKCAIRGDAKMLRRFERLLIATATAVLAAGATLLIARAQDPTPSLPSPSGQQAPPCCCRTAVERMEGRDRWRGPHIPQGLEQPGSAGRLSRVPRHQLRSGDGYMAGGRCGV